ncbi:MAG: GTP pyrophosphokinase family protein [Lachnospiraceae bacterium]|nr:GTP pyrophosphokinase family protein [Lachnoclostridium sp.]MDD7522465.1 GTP pyrophosphokinase family protein [Lachnoclostridium sp.]MDY2599215.1 GTP pyrophosphokinase family protein [Lachnospiraceae bacterium]
METRMWREMLVPYYAAVDELKMKFEHIIRECRDTGVYSPIEQVEGRVKRIPSILEKAQKKDIEIEDIERDIQDIAGIRIICQFVEDINAVVNIIRNRTDMKIIEERDYVTNSKPSGYRSYHIIIEYDVHMYEGVKKIKAEIQIRTLAMNFWGTIEHSLQYKYHGQMPNHIRARLHAAADAIIMLDKEMSSVRGEIMDAQNNMQKTDTVIMEVLNNIENLYGVANTREINKIQDEFYRIYEQNDMEQLQKFNNELDIFTEGYRAQKI